MSYNFSNWFSWKNRNDLEGIKYPGIYCIAVSDVDISNQPFQWIPEIVYIGMTISHAGLKGRLQQFDNTINWKNGHGGGDRFRTKHPEYQNILPRLFVAIQSFECDAKTDSVNSFKIKGKVAKHEYDCFAKYVDKFKKLPEFNDHKRSPKGKSKTQETFKFSNKPKLTILSEPEFITERLKWFQLNERIISETTDNHYPIVLIPKNNSPIKPSRIGRSMNKGFCEDKFQRVLDNYLGKSFEIYNNRHVPINAQSYPFEPDFVIKIEREDLFFLIDIEIDEPYDGITRKPTHEMGKDDFRNDFFTERGWIVIRFAEIQIHQEPISCCAFIASILGQLDKGFNVPNEILDAEKISIVKHWSKNQCIEWARKKKREKYLGIKKFNNNHVVLPEFEIKPSQYDIDIELEIEKTKSIQADKQITDKKDDNSVSYAISGQIPDRYNMFEIKSGIVVRAFQHKNNLEELVGLLIAVKKKAGAENDVKIPNSITIYTKKEIFEKIIGYKYDFYLQQLLFESNIEFSYSYVEAGAKYNYLNSNKVYINKKVDRNGNKIPMQISTVISIEFREDLKVRLKKCQPIN